MLQVPWEVSQCSCGRTRPRSLEEQAAYQEEADQTMKKRAASSQLFNKRLKYAGLVVSLVVCAIALAVSFLADLEIATGIAFFAGLIAVGYIANITGLSKFC